MLNHLIFYSLILVGVFLCFYAGIQISEKTRGSSLVVALGCAISASVGLVLPLVLALKLNIFETWALTDFGSLLIAGLFGIMYFGGYFLVGLLRAAANSS